MLASGFPAQGLRSRVYRVGGFLVSRWKEGPKKLVEGSPAFFGSTACMDHKFAAERLANGSRRP